MNTIGGITHDSGVVMILPIAPEQRKELEEKLAWGPKREREEILEEVKATPEEKAAMKKDFLEKEVVKAYQGMLKHYDDRIKAREKGETTQPLSDIWNDQAKEGFSKDDKIMVKYKKRKRRPFKWKTTFLSPSVLEDMANAKKKLGTDFSLGIRETDEAKYYALIDLGMKAIKTYMSDESLRTLKDKTEREEAKFMIAHTYFAMYVLDEHMKKEYYEVFAQIAKHGRNSRHKETRDLAKDVGELRRVYAISFKQGYGQQYIRRSSKILEEMRKTQGERMEELTGEVYREEKRTTTEK